MPRKEFDAFTRLDASDINTFLMDQSVMVFAGTAARGLAIPTPSDGMAAYLQDSDSLTIYDGSSWTEAGKKSTLQFINTTTFSTATTVSLDSVFTATYVNYKVLVNITAASVNGAQLNLRTRTVGPPPADETGSNYRVGEYKVGVANSQAADSTNNSLLTNGTLGLMSSTSGFGVEINMYSPFSANRTKFAAIGAGGNLQITGMAMIVNTSYGGLTIFPSSGNITGTMTVYGIKES
jgi:hypothetical protein